MLKELYKLSKALVKLSETKTDKGTLIAESELEQGVEVFIDDDEQGLVQAQDGEYKAEDKVIVVADGKVAEIKAIEEEPIAPVEEMACNPKEKMAEEEPKAEEPKAEEEQLEDEKDLRIQELEGLLKDRDYVIEELNNKIKELEDKLKEPVEESVKMSVMSHAMATANTKDNPALKFFSK